MVLLHIVLLVTGYALMHLLDKSGHYLLCSQLIIVKLVVYLSRAFIDSDFVIAYEFFLQLKLLVAHVPQKARQKRERPIKVSFLQVQSAFCIIAHFIAILPCDANQRVGAFCLVQYNVDPSRIVQRRLFNHGLLCLT